MSIDRLTEPLDRQIDSLAGDWRDEVDAWRCSQAGKLLINRVDQAAAAGARVYPPRVFRALELTPLSETRVVILGQDPYHSAGQAEGLAFSVPPGVRVPPSLRNIFKELRRDLGLPVPASGHLGAWAAQGVLLLNVSLSVEDGVPGGHANWGWHSLTDRLVGAVARCARPKVFMLWGAHAQSKADLIDQVPHRHLVLRCNHPSPLAANRPPAPFVGCGHFGQASRFLFQHHPDAPALDWSLGSP